MIRGDVARDALDGLGLKHFLDVRCTVRRVLGGMDRWQRTAFAAAVTQRLLPGDGPPGGEHPDISYWRPVVAAIWAGLAGEPAATGQVATAVGRFYLSPAFHGRGHDDPGDAADHAIMAACYTAECFVHGCLDFAAWAGWRGFDVAALHAAADVAWPHRRPPGVTAYAWELAHPQIQAELDLQLVDLELLAAVDGEPAVRGVRCRLLERLRTGSRPAPPRTGAEPPREPEDLLAAEGKDPTPANLEDARRRLAEEGPAAIEKTVP